jgi:hypothetical protein
LSVTTLVLTSFVFTCLGLISGLAGWMLAIVFNIPAKGGLQLEKKKLSTRIAISCIIGSGFSFAVAIIAIVLAGVWWVWLQILPDLTPRALALISIAVAPTPLLLTILAISVASLLGCKVDASGAQNCFFLGKDVSRIINSLFMAYWLIIFTFGLSVIGLVASGIWALSN